LVLYNLSNVYLLLWGKENQNQSLLMFLAKMKLISIMVLIGTETFSITAHIK
jgi:hypothetical protein